MSTPPTNPAPLVLSDDPRLAGPTSRTLPLTNGWTGTVTATRTGDWVEIRGVGITGTAASSIALLDLARDVRPGPAGPAFGVGNPTAASAADNAPIAACGGAENQIVRVASGSSSAWTGGSFSISFRCPFPPA